MRLRRNSQDLTQSEEREITNRDITPEPIIMHYVGLKYRNNETGI